MNINDRIRGLRTLKDLTQNDIAKALQIPRPTYAKYENNINPPYDAIQKIAEYFKVSIDYLISGESSKECLPEKETLLLTKNDSGGHNLIDITQDKNLQELIKIFTKLSPEGQDTIFKMAQNMAEYERQRAMSKELRA